MASRTTVASDPQSPVETPGQTSGKVPGQVPSGATGGTLGDTSGSLFYRVFGRLFGGLRMGWPAVVAFAVVAGLYTGAMGSIPATYGTSLRDIAISFEWWVIFEFVIAANCRGVWECGAKTLAFFTISQPVIYAVEILSGGIDPQVALMAYCGTWGPETLLTLPGGMLAHCIRRQDALGAAVLGLGNAIQAFVGLAYVVQMLQNPPFHLLSALVSFASIAVMCLAIQRTRRGRAICLLTTVAAIAAVLVFLRLSGRVIV